jgi:hypothetical protein
MPYDRTAFDCKEQLISGHCFCVCVIFSIPSDRDALKTVYQYLGASSVTRCGAPRSERCQWPQTQITNFKKIPVFY